MRFFVVLFNVPLWAMLFALPNLTRPGLLFGVPVPPGCREGPDGRRAIRAFRMVVGPAVLGALCASLSVPLNALGLLMAGAACGILLTAGVAFHMQYRRLGPIAVSVAPVREAELATIPDRLPWFVWLAVIPFATLIAAAWYLHLNWDRIPARLPVHWGVEGLPNKWAEQTVKGVYGPLVFGAEMCAFLLVFALADWYGSRRSRSRGVLLASMVGVTCFVGLSCAWDGVDPLLNIHSRFFVLGPPVGVILFVIVILRKFMASEDPLEPTPNECWKAGMIYYNPDDAALFVQKRSGLGYTFNFANPWSWVLLLGLALVIASAVLA